MSEIGIRDRIFTDMIEDYAENENKSFLYKYFEGESNKKELPAEVQHFCTTIQTTILHTTILKEENPCKTLAHLNELKKQISPDNRKELLQGHAAQKTALADHLLQEPQKDSRSDFYMELKLRDFAYHTGVITDTQYYLWLVSYLDLHSKYYMETGRPKAHEILYILINRMKEGLSQAQNEAQKNKDKPTKSDVQRDLRFLNDLLHNADENVKKKIEMQLTDITCLLKNEKTKKKINYLTWLTRHLANCALHIKIRTFLQDSGYPIDKDGLIQKQKKPRKKDFSMCLMEAYCKEANWRLIKMQSSGDPDNTYNNEGYYDAKSHMYYYFEEDTTLSQLMDYLDKQDASTNQNKQLFIPLVIDSVSGCMLAVFGKANYKTLYSIQEEKINSMLPHADKRNKAKLKLELAQIKKYNEPTEKWWCFDYMELDETYCDLDKKTFFGKYAWSQGAPYRLRRRFLENADKSYRDVLSDFKYYCNEDKNYFDEDHKTFFSSKTSINHVNGEASDNLPPIFQQFFWE